MMLDETSPRTGDLVEYHNYRFYFKANGTSCYLLHKKGDSKTEKVFSPATRSVRLVSRETEGGQSSFEEFYTPSTATSTPTLSPFLSAVIKACLNSTTIDPSQDVVWPSNIEADLCRGETAAHIAASSGNGTVLRQLATRFPNALIVQDPCGDTPLHIVNACGYEELFDELASEHPKAARLKNSSGVVASANTPDTFAPQVYPIVWVATAEGSKNYKPHRFPIGTSLREALDILELDSEPVEFFPNLLKKGGTPVFTKPILNLDYRMAASQDFICKTKTTKLHQRPLSPTSLDYESFSDSDVESECE
eukprot:TRINITY_DN14445_c0_g1_i1.p1 TRINITY_DN14445_c0_g1~~TRINITY_DN14445_c0_g1_i1.p1  ORF type:complete len:307 (-),score=57.87 TRINITY_DN14445_c0_g1_i1:152-1072(-)